LDDDKRLLSREVAERAAARLRGQAGTVRACTRDRQAEPPPLPYALADLQIDAGKRAGLTAQAALDACQQLYETHRLITYPRSDCSHLPESHYPQARRVLESIGRQVPSLESAVRAADLSRRSKAWNDKKITAHHAIIPTCRPDAPRVQLSTEQHAVYELVAKRYLAQFYGPHEYLQTRIELEIAGQALVATGRQTTSAGWQQLLTHDREDAGGAVSAQGEAESKAPLPLLEIGDRITAEQVSIAEKRTEPPKAFTDASLIAAMRGVAKFVDDPKLKRILTETDGIGTPATRAAIIETLFERGYVVRQSRAIVSTPTGKALIAVLPVALTSPDRTAIWEAAMRVIADGKGSLEQFLERMTSELGELVRTGRAFGRISVPGATHKPPSKTPSRVASTRRPRRSHARP
jgi:DNA topoisomerase-3